MGRESEQPTEELSASAAKRETRLRLEERVGAKSDAVKKERLGWAVYVGFLW